MNIELTKSFIKDFKKLDIRIRKRFIEKKNIFLENPFDRILNNHSLLGEWKNFRSINITSDLRVIYYIKNNVYYFVRIGTHSQLYKYFF